MNKSVPEIIAEGNRELKEKELRNEFSEEDEIQNEKEANQEINTIRIIKKKIENKEDEIQKEIEDLQEKIDSKKKNLRNYKEEKKTEIEESKKRLKEYAEVLRKNNSNKKTFYFPDGKLRFRKRPPKWDYPENEEKIIEQCKKAGLEDAIQSRERVHKTRFKDKVEVKEDGEIVNPDTGDVIEGVKVSEREDHFKVDTN